MNRLTKLQQVGAVGVLTKKLAGQLRGKDMVDHLSRECVDFYRSKSVVTGKEVNGIGRTESKHVSLRDPLTGDLLASRHCTSQLDAEVLALIWAVHGTDTK